MIKASYKVIHKDKKTGARAGVLRTPHGEVKTPVFMPVGTQATVKTVSAQDLDNLGAQIMLSNAYHLYLRPGDELIGRLGGLHPFMGWKKPILTDSGGFQIFSLNEPKKITKEGWEFKSHLDGSKHFLTPEKVVRIQKNLGSDILMPLDKCVTYPVDKNEADEALDITHQWLVRSKETWMNEGNEGSLLFGIIQGSTFKDLRKKAVDLVLPLDLPGYAIGGLSVGEPQDLMLETLQETMALMPQDKPRYLMGVGYPEDLVLSVERGVDMFDCVAPTRNGRNGTVFNSEGKLLIRNKEFENDLRPIEEGFSDVPDLNHSRAYLRHLFNAHEILGMRLASLWNLHYFIHLVDQMREAILEDRFLEFKRDFFSKRKITVATRA